MAKCKFACNAATQCKWVPLKILRLAEQLCNRPLASTSLAPDLRSNMKSIAAKTGDFLGDPPLRVTDSVSDCQIVIGSMKKGAWSCDVLNESNESNEF